MAERHPRARLRRAFQRIRLRRYVRKYEARYSRPALRQQLLAAGYAPHLIDQVLTQPPGGRPASPRARRVLFGTACGVGLLGNVLVYQYVPRYWFGILWAEALAAAYFLAAGADPLVATRWSWWYAPPDDASQEAWMQRQAERGVVRSLGCGWLVGLLLAGGLVVLLGR